MIYIGLIVLGIINNPQIILSISGNVYRSYANATVIYVKDLSSSGFGYLQMV